VVSILKPGKDPTLPLSYIPISLLHTVGKNFERSYSLEFSEKLDFSECGLQREEHFGFRHGHSTAMQPGRLFERVNTNFDERRLTGAVFLYVAKAFYTVCVKGLL
jgi:hypothetical protein